MLGSPIFILVAATLAGHISATATAAPCISATPDCTEWIRLPGQPTRVLVYRTKALGVRDGRVTRAVVFVHGILRDADNHFRTAVAAGFLAGALDDTIIVAPRFASDTRTRGNDAGNCSDPLADNEANWICDSQSPDSWKSGGTTADGGELSSFDFMDQILRQVARKDTFPNLKSVVVAGHSAGGQFVIRYAMLNRVEQRLGVPVSYLVANPSSYAYVDDVRPTASAFPPTVLTRIQQRPVAPLSGASPAFLPFSAKSCGGYNAWPYGLENRPRYSSRLTDDQITKQLVTRRVTYLLGQVDVFALGVFDTSCPATAQGPNRLERGLAFHKYVNDDHGAHHQLVVVPFCGHSQRCIFTSDAVLPLMFPR